MRARLSGAVSLQAGKAALAAWTAASTSSTEASATEPVTLPVAGLNTSLKRPLVGAAGAPPI